jgi:hypothetical protein
LKNGRIWVDAREIQRMSKRKWRDSWLVKGKEGNGLNRCPVPLAKDEIDTKRRTNDPYFSGNTGFKKNFYREYAVAWERILSEHLRKELYSIFNNTTLAHTFKEQDRKEICLIHIYLIDRWTDV